MYKCFIIDEYTSSSDTADSEEMILTTKGDHNPIPDRYPVTADSYLGRMLWSIDYIGAVLLFLYSWFDALITITVITSLTSAVVTILQQLLAKSVKQ